MGDTKEYIKGDKQEAYVKETLTRALNEASYERKNYTFCRIRPSVQTTCKEIQVAVG